MVKKDKRKKMPTISTGTENKCPFLSCHYYKTGEQAGKWPCQGHAEVGASFKQIRNLIPIKGFDIYFQN